MNNTIFIPTKMSSLKEWLYYIEHLHHTSVDLTLDRVRGIAIHLGLMHPGKYIILVGGTNGKGTTCRLLEVILLNSNVRVGLYTSPHLLSYNERIRVCGRELSDDVHIKAMSVIEDIRNHIELTYFEFSTLSALYIFKQEKLDVIILEVGLGGRLDATNIVDADISVITNIAVDHTEFLGVNRYMIAREKSGIFRINKPAVIGEINRPIIIDEIAEDQGAILFARGRDWNYRIFLNQWSWQDHNNCRLLSLLPFPIIPIENAAIVLSILYWLPYLISRTAIDYGLRIATLPGRFQIIQRKPFVILDVGHNPHAASYLAQQLSTIVSTMDNVRMVIGMLRNKDICGTINCLHRVVDVWYFAALNTLFSADPRQLFNCLPHSANIQQFSSILDAWDQAMLDASVNDCVVVFGSFYAVSPILAKVISSSN